MGGMTPKGVRYGGRAKGTPNKRTAELYRQSLERGPDAPLAKEVMEEIMLNYLEMARMSQPLPGEQATPEQKAEYARWGNMAAEVGAKLAPYQSATYKAVLIPDQHTSNQILTDVVFRIFERPRKPLLIEHKAGNGKIIEAKAAAAEEAA
jgi:hypothetical protein